MCIDMEMASQFQRFKKESAGSKAFTVINYLFLALVSLACLLPFLFVLAASFSPIEEILTRKFFIIPHRIDLTAYQYLFSSDTLIKSVGISLWITVVGTVLSTGLTILTAYALSKPGMPGRRFINAMIVFTLLFNGGMIPTYLVVAGLGMKDTLWALWLPNAISAYNMILLRNTFSQMNPSLEEAAVIDGCNPLQILRRIVIPLSKPSIATFALFYAVGYWNNYFDAMLYIDNDKLWPIQIWLRQIVLLSSGGFTDNSAVESLGYVPPKNISYAVIVFATVPILAVYPFVQKYFTKGIMMGSVKG